MSNHENQEPGQNTPQDEILYEGPGYTIAQCSKAETLVPYGKATRPNGEVNYGWIDLRGKPELVMAIPEAQRSEGLAALLRVIADPISKIMSGACACGAFDRRDEREGPRWQVGGFVTIMFNDMDTNSSSNRFVDLARYILSGIERTDEHHIGFELVIEPLKQLFERSNCFCLTLKPLGYGATESVAWAAFNYAATAASKAIQRDRIKGCRTTS